MTKGKILDMEKYRIINILKRKGFQWFEDEKGRVKLWIKTGHAVSAKTLLKKT